MTSPTSHTPTSSRARRRRGPAGSAGTANAGNNGGATRSQNRPAVERPPAIAPLPVDDLPVQTPAIDDLRTFAELGVPAPIVAVMVASGIDQPFPIQSATLIDSLAGRDVLGRGKTGSGKTIAFAIPVCAALAASGKRRQPNRPRALILVPTRELANQVAETITPLASAMGLTTSVIFGGVGQGPQVAALKRGIDVLVACPGRLEDLIQQRQCRLDAVEVTVLDEADHMADLGFLPAVTRLLGQTPSGTQRLLFSATLDRGIDVLVRKFLADPVTHSVDSVSSPVSEMTHHVFSVSLADKPALVHALASGMERSLLFTRTKHGAKKLAKQLTAAGTPAVELHGNLSQNARERNLEAFTDGSARVLVATDIAARGIHVDEIALVVHVDPPAEHKAYLHRSGRTARAGAAGIVVTVMTPDQAGDVRQLARAAGIQPVISTVTAGHPAVTTLVGPAAAKVTPAPLAPEHQQSSQRTGQRQGARGGQGPTQRTGQGRGGQGRSGQGSGQARTELRSGTPRRAGRTTGQRRG